MTAGIALGSNLGDRHANLHTAKRHLFALHDSSGPFLCSRTYATEPVDCPPSSPAFLNAAIELRTKLPPLDLLAELQRIEALLGRPRDHGFHTPRTIDLDILYCDNLAFTLPELQIPHPRIAERPFVLLPLADIQPDKILPGKSSTIASLLAALPAGDLPKPVAGF